MIKPSKNPSAQNSTISSKKANIYVDNLPDFIRNHMLMHHFRKYGEVRYARIFRKQNWPNYGVVCFKSQKAVEKVFDNLVSVNFLSIKYEIKTNQRKL